MAVLKEGEMYQSFRFGSIIGSEFKMRKRYAEMGCCEKCWHHINEKVMKPLFGKKEKNKREDMNSSIRVTILKKSVYEGHDNNESEHSDKHEPRPIRGMFGNVHAVSDEPVPVVAIKE